MLFYTIIIFEMNQWTVPVYPGGGWQLMFVLSVVLVTGELECEIFCYCSQ